MSRVERSEGAVGTGDAWGRRQIRSQSDRASRPLFPLPPDKFDALLYGIQDKTRKDALALPESARGGRACGSKRSRLTYLTVSQMLLVLFGVWIK